MSSLDVEGELRELKRRIRALETQSPLESSAVKNGRVRFIGGLLRIEAGGRLEIEGTLEIDGTTTVTGTFTVTGPWSLDGDGAITGDVTITGKLVQNGDWELNGNGDITGDVELTGDLNVTAAGRVNVGTAMRLNPSSSGGAIEFTTGLITGASGALSVAFTGGGQLVLNSTANLVGSGCTIRAGSAPQIVGLPTINRTTIGSPPVGTVYADASGNLFRAT